MMRLIYASGLLTIIRALDAWVGVDDSSDKKIDEATRKDIGEKFASYTETFLEIGFAASVATINKIVEKVKTECGWGELAPLGTELLGRLIDETNTREFFTMTLRESELFESPRKGWELSVKRFPQIVDDVDEASKCYALSRYAAAVFHSVQVVEAGLIEVGRFLKIKDPHSGWTSVTAALRKVRDKKHGERTNFEKKNFKFLEQLHGTVEALKDAWRNKISHSDGRLVILSGEFHPDVAEEILIATRGFMRRLAEGLPPPKPPKGAARRNTAVIDDVARAMLE